MGKEVRHDLWAVMADSADADQALSARHEIAVHYQFLVEGIARKLKVSLPTFVSDEDLISYGQIGLLRAMDRYNPEAGPFSRYASAVIYGAIMDEIRALDWAPRGLRKDQRDLEAVCSQGTSNDLEAAMALGWDVSKVSDVKRRVAKADLSSYNDLMQSSENVEGDNDAYCVAGALMNDMVEWLDSQFDFVTACVVWLRYYYGMTIQNIGETLEMPISTVRTIHNEFLQQLIPFVESQVSVG